MSNFGLTSAEISEVRHINPETAAHNIALAYISLSAKPAKLLQGEDAVVSDVLSMSSQYIDAYNYAYSLISNENKTIDEAE